MTKKIKNIFLVSTDTVCGIGTFVTNPNLEDLYQLKNRDKNKKIIILGGSKEQIKQYALDNHIFWSDDVENMATKVWPGDTTLIIGDQGFRVPNCIELQNFLLQNGLAYVTSANVSGEKPLTFEKAKEYFKEIVHQYDFCQTPTQKASTIIDVDNGRKIR